MICNYCNEEIPVGNKFCPTCGQPVERKRNTGASTEEEPREKPRYRSSNGEDTVSSSTRPTYQRRERLPPPPPVVQKNPINLKLIASGVALFFGLMIVVGLLGGEKEETTATDLSTPSTSAVPSESPSTTTEEITVSLDLLPSVSDSASSTTDTLSTPSEEVVVELYCQLAQEYQAKENAKWTIDQYYDAGMIEMAGYYYGPSNMLVLFHDFDENGIPEMLVAGNDERIIGLYTISNESGTYKPKLLISGGFYSELELTEELYIYEFLYGETGSISILEVKGSSLQNTEVGGSVDMYTGSYDYMPMTDLLTSNTSTTSVTSNLTYYKPIMDTIYTALKNKSDFTTLREQELSDLYFYNDLSSVGFAFADINSDGKDELMIGDLEGNTENVIALYSMVETGPKLIFNGGERSFYVVCTDGLIAHSGANSAFSTDFFTYELTPYGLVLVNDSRVKDFFNLTDVFIPTYKSFSSY